MYGPPRACKKNFRGEIQSAANQFLDAIEQVAADVKRGVEVAVHCRAGIRRSSMLVASRLGWNVDEAFRAVEKARGCTVPDTSEQEEWVRRSVHSQ
jgi:protein-tyrosine phosphatase